MSLELSYDKDDVYRQRWTDMMKPIDSPTILLQRVWNKDGNASTFIYHSSLLSQINYVVCACLYIWLIDLFKQPPIISPPAENGIHFDT